MLTDFDIIRGILVFVLSFPILPKRNKKMTTQEKNTNVLFEDFIKMVTDGQKSFQNIDICPPSSDGVKYIIPDLNGLNFTNVYFLGLFKWSHNYNIHFSKISNCKFINCSFKLVNFAGEIKGGDFSQCEFYLCLLSARLDLVHFTECDITDSTFKEETPKIKSLSEYSSVSVSFKETKIKETHFNNKHAFNFLFYKCALSGIRFVDSNWTQLSILRSIIKYCHFYNSKISGSSFMDDEIEYTKFSDSEFQVVSMLDCTLTQAEMDRCKHFGFNTSRTKGLITAREFMSKFEKDEKGYIVYKALGDTDYKPSPLWKIEEGSYIEENANPNRFEDCGCGVNFGTLDYVKTYYQRYKIWKCRIDFDDAPGIVVPYFTTGKARCERLYLIEKIDK